MIGVLIVPLLLGQTTTTTQTPTDLGDLIVKFCRSNLDERVGVGECSDLADQALKSVGANSQRLPDSPKPGDYVWGDLVYSLSANAGNIVEQPDWHARLKVKPGDIVQFRDVTIGRQTSNSYYWLTLPHHTAVMAEVKNRGMSWIVYEQNANKRRYVVKDPIELGDIQGGYLNVYRATVRKPSGK